MTPKIEFWVSCTDMNKAMMDFQGHRLTCGFFVPDEVLKTREVLRHLRSLLCEICLHNARIRSHWAWDSFLCWLVLVRVTNHLVLHALEIGCFALLSGFSILMRVVSRAPRVRIFLNEMLTWVVLHRDSLHWHRVQHLRIAGSQVVSHGCWVYKRVHVIWYFIWFWSRIRHRHVVDWWSGCETELLDLCHGSVRRMTQPISALSQFARIGFPWLLLDFVSDLEVKGWILTFRRISLIAFWVGRDFGAWVLLCHSSYLLLSKLGLLEFIYLLLFTV